jgi:DNA-binding response OmpR family regulator
MKKILIVDDKSSISDLLTKFLRSKYEIEVRSDGIDALIWLQEGNIPDLILTDLQMPNMDGLELINKVKSSGYFSDVPIIVLSSKDSSNDRIQCLKAGAEDYIMKPFNPEELLIRIEKVLGR